MSSSVAPAGTITLPPRVVYPEREDRSDNWLDRLGTAVAGLPAVLGPGLYAGRLSRVVHQTRLAGLELRDLGRQDMAGRTAALRAALRAGDFADDAVARAFALIRETAERTIGLRHFDVQVLGGFALLKGMVAEMETGEGKTLTATLPACTAALARIPVHVVTVNDYLAQRDAETMGPVYQALGLTVGTVVHGMAPDQRRAAYRCDVTYGSNKELAFDYLRDRMVLGKDPSNLRLKLEGLYGRETRSSRLVMRGLHFAIVDEADSVLIDEARTPLIISGRTDPGDEQRRAEQALALVEPLRLGGDYQILAEERRIELTESGRQHLAELAEKEGDLWMGRIRREEAARQALTAKHLFRRDEHYLVRDGKVQIIDEYTGRVMADRSWSEGLHQLVEVKEGCEATGQNVPLARMTYQRFFRRYRHLSGMTGTAREVAGELWSVYRLPVVTVPTNRPLRRAREPNRIAPTAERKWRMIAARVAELHRQGRPVLLGTRSVAASDSASQYLSEAGLEHVVLSAAQDRHEAEIIAQAGQSGRITIATNMAGRGVDIKLGEGVAELGGLQVIMSERHDAGRIDRQLLGRCGRQGEPGAGAAILSLEDPVLEILGNSLLLSLARLPGRLGQWGGRLVFNRAQSKAERTHSRMRRELVRYDQKLGTLLAFSGRME